MCYYPQKIYSRFSKKGFYYRPCGICYGCINMSAGNKKGINYRELYVKKELKENTK